MVDEQAEQEGDARRHQHEQHERLISPAVGSPVIGGEPQHGETQTPFPAEPGDQGGGIRGREDCESHRHQPAGSSISH